MEEEIAKTKEYAITDQGFRVWRCCSSCALCVPDNNGMRLCVKKNRRTRPTSLCEKWTMRPKLNHLGSGETQEPKRKDYLDYVLERRLTEDQLIKQKLMSTKDRASIFSIRQQWEHDNKTSIFMTL